MKQFLQVSGNPNISKMEKEMKCPLPLQVIPNNMGINLCAVDYVEWEREDDGSLVNVNIVFKGE